MANEYRVGQIAVEVVHSGTPVARVGQLAIEVVRSQADAPPPGTGRRRQALMGRI